MSLRHLLARIRSPRWLLAFLLATAICLAVFVVNGLVSDYDPGNNWGLSYGISAAALLLAATAYVVRRRTAGRAPGASRHWLQFHIYGGTLFLILVLMHTGFRLPDGLLAWTMWLASIWLVLSGMVGVILQRWIPALLTSGLSTEVLYDRIPELVDATRKKAEMLVRGSDEPIRDFYDHSLAAAMLAPKPRLIYCIDVAGGIQARTRQFNHVRNLLPPEETEKLRELETLYKAKLEIDAHYTLQRLLRWWLYGHVPVSLMLIALVMVHVLSILYY